MSTANILLLKYVVLDKSKHVNLFVSQFLNFFLYLIKLITFSFVTL